MSRYSGPVIRVPPPGPRAREIIARDQRILSTSLSRTAPVVAARGSGPYVEDVDGNVYLDFGSGFGVANLGYNHPRVVEAIRRQVEELIFFNSNDYHSVPQVDYAERLAGLTPGGFPKRVFFTNSGAEAVEAAIKAAKYHTRRHGMIAFTGGFHGRTMGALALTTTSSVTRRHYTGSMMGHVVYAPFADPYRNPFAGDCATETLRFLEEQILERIMPPEDCAAVIFEPVQGAGGYIVPPVEFLQGLQSLCRERGILLIADEIQTGFGRTGHPFASQAFGLEPDILCLSKAIAQGLPMGAIVARAELLDWVAGTHESTLSGNPVAVTAAMAVLDVLEAERLGENAVRIGQRLMEGLRRLQRRFPLIGDVRGLGAMVGLELVRDRATKEPATSERDILIRACFEHGLLVLGAGRSSIRLAPPLVLNQEEVDVGLAILEQAVTAVAG